MWSDSGFTKTTLTLKLFEDMATVEDYLKNKKWVKRLSEAFVQLDIKKEGYVSRENWLDIVDNIAKVVTDRPALIARLREVSLEFTTAVGLTEGVRANKKKFLELMASMALTEIAKVRRGEASLVKEMNNAFFDVVDRTYDGYVTWDEYQIVMKAGNFSPDAIESSFTLLDKNKIGKIKRKDFIDADFKFWLHLDDPDTRGMFGDKFE